jgi:hypothetical protein
MTRLIATERATVNGFAARLMWGCMGPPSASPRI